MPLRLAIAALAVVVIGAALAAPIVLRNGSGGENACTRTLDFDGRRYVARRVPPSQVVQAIAIGVGLARGCGAPPANVDLRSLSGIERTAAVGISGDQSSVYVRRGVCRAASSHELVRCLRSD